MGPVSRPTLSWGKTDRASSVATEVAECSCAVVLRADGLACDKLLAGIIPLFELDSYATPVVMMEAVKGDALDPEVEKAYRAALKYNGKIELMERYAFYERAKKAYAIVITGETRKYGNVILKKGVTPFES